MVEMYGQNIMFTIKAARAAKHWWAANRSKKYRCNVGNKINLVK